MPAVRTYLLKRSLSLVPTLVGVTILVFLMVRMIPGSIVEQMLGYQADEIIGKHHVDLFAAAEKERITALGQKKFGTGARMFRERFRLLTKDGRVVIHETTAEPIIDSHGQFSGYRGVNRDITNQVRFVRLRP